MNIPIVMLVVTATYKAQCVYYGDRHCGSGWRRKKMREKFCRKPRGPNRSFSEELLWRPKRRNTSESKIFLRGPNTSMWSPSTRNSKYFPQSHTEGCLVYLCNSECSSNKNILKRFHQLHSKIILKKNWKNTLVGPKQVWIWLERRRPIKLTQISLHGRKAINNHVIKKAINNRIMKIRHRCQLWKLFSQEYAP